MPHRPFKQGIYKPINKEKFFGREVMYRSSFELRFAKWCDINPNVVKWSSENAVIPYISPVDGRIHRYFVDNIVHIKEGNNIVKYLVEIKPYSQTIPPSPSKRKKQSTVIYEQVTYAVNTAKWEAAREWAKKNNYRFQLITERELFNG